MAKRRQRPAKRAKRRPVNRARMPNHPPPVNLNPWRRVTLSTALKASGDEQAFIASDVIKLVMTQIDTTVPSGHYTLLRINRVRIWNREDGPILLAPYSLIRPIQAAWVDEPLKVFEEYPGKAVYASVQYTWPRIHQNAIMNDDSNATNSDHSSTQVIFTYKAKKDSWIIMHLVCLWKTSVAASFSLSHTARLNNSQRREVTVNLGEKPEPSAAPEDQPVSPDIGFEHLQVESPA